MANSTPFDMPALGGTRIVNGDFNGDGRSDIFVVNYDWPTGAKASTYAVLLGDGAGSYTVAQNVAAPAFSFPGKPLVADFNQDGYDDIFVGTYGNELLQTGAEDLVLLGGATGVMTEKRSLAGVKTWAHGSSLGDLNNDGYTDIVNGGIGPLPSSAWLNDKAGGYTLSTTALPADAFPYFQTSSVWSTLVSDLNGDGLNDLVIGHSGGEYALRPYGYSGTGAPASVFYATAQGGWTRAALPTGKFGAVNTDTVSIAQGDFDGDGRVDLLLSNYDKGAFVENGKVVYTGDANSGASAGTFTAGGETLTKAGMDNRDLQLLLNKEGGWVDASASILSGNSALLNYVTAVKAIDLDGDGDLDIAGMLAAHLTADSTGPFLWLNDGKGQFTALDTRGYGAGMASSVWEWGYTDVSGAGDWRMAAAVSSDAIYPKLELALSGPLVTKVGIGGTAGDDALHADEAVAIPVYAHGGDDTLVFTGLSAKADLGAGNDTIRAGSGNATIIGGAGDDTIEGGAGDDVIDGGSGFDYARYSGKRADFKVTSNGGSIAVADQKGGEGSDTLTGVERVRFDDVDLRFDADGVGGQTYRLYQAAFGRTPDLGGLSYWVSAADGGTSMMAIATSFVDSPEFKGLYGAAPTSAEIVDRFYENVLHRDGEEAGFKYWVNLLDTRQLTVAQVLSDFANGPENTAALVGVLQNGIEFTPA